MDTRAIRPTFLPLNSKLTNSKSTTPDYHPFKSPDPFTLKTFAKNRTSPTDSGIFSVGSYNSTDDRTPLTTFDISPFCENNFNKFSEFKSPNRSGRSTFNSPTFSSPTINSPTINSPIYGNSFDFNKFSELRSPNRFDHSTNSSIYKPLNNRFANSITDSTASYKTSNQSFYGSSLTDKANKFSKFKNNSDTDYQFNIFTPSPVNERINLLDTINRNQQQFNAWPITKRINRLDDGSNNNSKYRIQNAQLINYEQQRKDHFSKYEQCDEDCEACIIPDELKRNDDFKQSDQCNDDCKKFYKLMNLADKIYEAHCHEFNPQSIVDPKTNLPLFFETKYCKFCKNNKEKSEIYLSHTTQNKAGEVTCPILMRYICETCGATGKQAHTRSYCPISREAIKNDDLNVAMRCSNMNPVVNH